jgi:hypothetical protein
MTRLIVLDSTPVGLMTNPKATELALQCQAWLLSLLRRGDIAILPEIVDYEIRRELLRANKQSGIRKLDQLKSELIYLPISTQTMLWAQVRKQGKPTADDRSLDGDVILAAQAISLITKDREVIVATSNKKHLSLFVDAKEWQENW